MGTYSGFQDDGKQSWHKLELPISSTHIGIGFLSPLPKIEFHHMAEDTAASGSQNSQSLSFSNEDQLPLCATTGHKVLEKNTD